MTKIILAYPCMGKTYYAQNNPEKALDLESSDYLFDKTGYEHLSSEEFKGIPDRKRKENGIADYLKAIDEAQLETSYKVDERNLNDYVFTTPSIADLSVKLRTDAPQNYNIRVTNLYADVSVSSKYSRFNGLRQDSINLNLTQAPNGGYDISTTDDYTQPFQIESVNQNESFIHGWNGYISEQYSYLTERDIKKHSNGAVLRTVWTLSVEDTQAHKTYSKTVSDTIFMPSHNED